MALVSLGPTERESEPWTHWSQDVMGDWRANFYTPVQPYLRRAMSVTGCGPNVRQRMEDMKLRADADMAAKGYVTFDKLPVEAQEYWAEADALWLVFNILSHLAERDAE